MKTIQKLFLLLITVFSLSACSSGGDDNPNNTPPDSGNTDKPTVITNDNKNTTGPIEAQSRLEFPKLRGGNSETIIHSTATYGMTYALEWDHQKRATRWVCWRMDETNRQEKYSRSTLYPNGDPWAYDPLVPEYEQQVFLQAMAKSQRKNPFVRVLNDNIPLILLLQTIRKLNADPNQNGCGISRRELPLLIFWKDNNADTLYRRIVKLREQFRYDPSDEIIIDICIEEIMEGNFKEFNPKSIMIDYPDEFIRKMRMTGLISLRGAGRFLDINKNEIETVDYILANYSHFKHYNTEREYFNYMAELDTNLIQISAKPAKASNSEKLLDEWLEVYNWSIIKKELSNLSSNKKSVDSVLKLLAAPSRLEFLTALAIKMKLPNVRVVPNYCCDDTGLPTSTAGGNKGDIECYEHLNGILVEVTMSTGRAQTMMEVWPIDRHLEEFQKEINAQCVFIAPSIYRDSLQQIQFVSYQSNGKRVIRPYAINDFVNYLENTHCLYHRVDKPVARFYNNEESLHPMVAENYDS